MPLVDEFEERGYVALPGCLDRATVSGVRRELIATWDRLERQEVRSMDAWRRLETVRRLASDPRVLDVVQQILGAEPVPFQTLNFSNGSQQPLHADTIHFDSLPSGLMCGVWIALEEVGPDQGPVKYVPGSHRLPALQPDEALDQNGHFDHVRYEAEVDLRVAGLPVLEFHAAPGDVLVWHANLVHGGAPVRLAGSSRWSQVTHYFGRGACYITPMHSDLDAKEYRMRSPLVDISSGRVVTHLLDGRPARMVHLWNGRTRILEPDDPVRTARELAVTTLLGAVRRVRWTLDPTIGRAMRQVRP